MLTENKLIYFHINGSSYIEMYTLLLKTIIPFINEYLHILVITTKDYYDEINRIHDSYNISIKFCHIMITTYKYDIGNYSGKLDIIDWEYLDNYDKIIYSDTDIIFFPNSLCKLFENIQEYNLIYCCIENIHFTEPWFFHDEIYSYKDVIKIYDNDMTFGINTGVFGWLHSKKVKTSPQERFEKLEVFSIIDQLSQIRNNIDERCLYIETSSWEQPYINHRWLVDGNISTIFTSIVSLHPEENIEYTDKALHFIGFFPDPENDIIMTTNKEDIIKNKLERMKYFSKFLEN